MVAPVEMRELRYFVALADEGSFTRAAARCYVTQQALSSAIAQLERRLGTQLFIRRPRGCSTTSAGQRLLVAARSILAAADQLPRAVDTPDPGHEGMLTVGLLLDGLGEHTWPVLQAFRAANPEVRVVVRRIQPHHLPTVLLDRSVDVALLHGPCNHEQLVVTPLFTERRYVVLSRSEERAYASELPVAELLDLPARPRREGIDPAWEGFFTLLTERNEAEPERRGEPTGSLEELLWAISLEELFLTVPEHLAKTYPGALYGVTYLPVPDLPQVVFSVARRRDDPRVRVRNFVELAMAATNIPNPTTHGD